MAEPIHPFLATQHERLQAEYWLACWRDSGPAAVAKHFDCPDSAGPLLKEVWFRANALPGPRLLIDGLWFTRPYGGVTRVWEQILSAWSLHDMCYPQSPIAILDRDSHLALTQCLESIDANRFDPLDLNAILASESENSKHAAAWSADVFLSSWTSSITPSSTLCAQLALVHDCVPERTPAAPRELLALRRHWLREARGHLAVSSATARDLEQLLARPSGSIPWCHPTFFDVQSQHPVAFVSDDSLWQEFSLSAGLTKPFVLLPGTSRVGSYKNPEIVARALLDPSLQSVHLVISGLNSLAYATALAEQWPVLSSRIIAVGCTDLQLSQLYRHALAVIMPSRVEGFGLPVVEALCQRAKVLIADSPGLREAASGAALRFDPDNPSELVRLIHLLLDEASAMWLLPRLERRTRRRLLDLPSSDLLGLSLLALARKLWAKSAAKPQPCP